MMTARGNVRVREINGGALTTGAAAGERGPKPCERTVAGATSSLELGGSRGGMPPMLVPIASPVDVGGGASMITGDRDCTASTWRRASSCARRSFSERRASSSMVRRSSCHLSRQEARA